MTVIVAAHTDKGISLAADSQITTGWHKDTEDACQKLWVSGQYVLGSSGCLRTAQVVKHHVTLPKYRPDEEPDFERFCVREIVPAIRAGVNDHGVVRTVDSGLWRVDMTLVIAVKAQMAVIYCNGAVGIPYLRTAIGSGASEAFGALGHSGPWTEKDVVNAAHQATITNLGCSGPIVVANTTSLKVREAKP